VKILVTGGAGFIGSHVVDAYVAQGHEVIVVDDLSNGKRENVTGRAHIVHLDIRDPALGKVFASYRPQVVNHHAAQIDVRRSVQDPAFDAEVNVLGTLRVLEQCRRSGVHRLIFASTGGAIYGEPKYLPMDENHPIAPLAPYGASKFAAEQFLRLGALTEGMTCVVLRYANVYGPRQDPLGEAGVVAIFTAAMLQGQTPTIYGDGTQTRDFVYVGDVAHANLLALDGDPGGPVNIGTGIGTSVNDVFSILAGLTGFRGQPIYASPRAGEIHTCYLDNSRAQQHLGWQPGTDLREGLACTVRAFAAQGP
jgi:UDP-glucose 4-epimerase